MGESRSGSAASLFGTSSSGASRFTGGLRDGSGAVSRSRLLALATLVTLVTLAALVKLVAVLSLAANGVGAGTVENGTGDRIANLRNVYSLYPGQLVVRRRV